MVEKHKRDKAWVKVREYSPRHVMGENGYDKDGKLCEIGEN